MGAAIVRFLAGEDEIQKNPLNPMLRSSKDLQVINAASLNYGGIINSPFEFYSGNYQQKVQLLSKIFLQQKELIFKNKKQWSKEFSKIDKYLKQRYSPLYNINCGIQNNQFVSQEKFKQLWWQNMKKQNVKDLKKEIVKQYKEKNQQQAFNLACQQALQFDLIAFQTLLFCVFFLQIQRIDDAIGKDVNLYLKKYKPFFQQSFLNQSTKLQKFKKGIQASLADVVFIQQPDEILIQYLQSLDKQYHLQISKDRDTLIFAKKSRFGQIKDNHQQKFLKQLSEQQYTKLNWNRHSCFMLLNNYLLISGHLNSNKEKNIGDVQNLKSIFPKLVQKFKKFQFICGVDTNSFVPAFCQKINVYPAVNDTYTTIKKRTSMQTQSSKSELVVRQVKDSIMTTLPIAFKEVRTISKKQIDVNEFLPLNDHPFDHFVIFASINEKK